MSNVIEDVFGSDWGSDIELRKEISEAINNTDAAPTTPSPASSRVPERAKRASSSSMRRRSRSPHDERRARKRRASKRQPHHSEPHQKQAAASEHESRHAVSSDDEAQRAPPSPPVSKKRRSSQLEASSKLKRAKRHKRSSAQLAALSDDEHHGVGGDDDGGGDDDDDDDDDDERVQRVEAPRRKRRSSAPRRQQRQSSVEREDEHEAAQPAKVEKPKTEFERVLDDAKALRRPRTREVDEQAVEAQCIDFLEKMMKARDDDMRAYRSGKPALNKLKMIREVELMIMKTSHREILLDNMLLSVVKAWLDPMPDGTLPNLTIRQSLLQILSDMPVDNEWIERLESSQGLGKVIHYLATKDTHAANRRSAEKLMMKWSRVVYQNNANFHDLLEEYARADNGNRIPSEGVAAERRHALDQLRSVRSTRQKLEAIKPYPGKERAQVLAAIPRPSPMLYTTLAESEAVSERAVRGGRVGKGPTRKVSKTISDLRRNNRRGSARASRPSINGRDR